jgi:anthranilate phosphoribosyltransferase
MMRAVLDNTAGPALDIVLLNAGAAIYVAGLAPTLDEGVQQARVVIENGSARARLVALIATSQRLASV